MNLDSKVWGPHYWFVLYSIALTYPITANNIPSGSCKISGSNPTMITPNMTNPITSHLLYETFSLRKKALIKTPVGIEHCIKIIIPDVEIEYCNDK